MQSPTAEAQALDPLARQRQREREDLLAAFAVDDDLPNAPSTPGPVAEDALRLSPGALYSAADWSQADPTPAAQQEPLEPAPDAAPDDRKRQQSEPPQSPSDPPLPEGLSEPLARLGDLLALPTVEPSAPAALGSALSAMPSSDLDALAGIIAAEDYGDAGYFKAAGYSSDYTRRLVVAGLSSRYEVARRFDSALTPATLLQRIVQPEADVAD